MKKLPKIFKNRVNNCNNRSVFYSLNDKPIETFDNSDVPINKEKKNYSLSTSKNGYSKEVAIILKDKTLNTRVVTKNKDYILTIDNEKIYFKDIIDIKEK